jgi:putative flippase GtrA
VPSLRYLSIGVVNYIISYVIFIVSLYLFYPRVSYHGVLFISYLLVIPINFLNQAILVWKNSDVDLRKFVKFNIIYGITFTFNLILMQIFVNWLDTSIYLFQFISGILLAILTFHANKAWTFK